MGVEVITTQGLLRSFPVSLMRIGDYRAAPIISAKDPATRAAGMPTATLTAPPVLVAEVAAAVLVADWTRGVEVIVAMLELGVMLALALALALGVAVTEWTRTSVLVMVIVEVEVVVSSATANWAAARQRNDVTKALICILSNWV